MIKGTGDRFLYREVRAGLFCAYRAGRGLEEIQEAQALIKDLSPAG